jgi:hypothetical protein
VIVYHRALLSIVEQSEKNQNNKGFMLIIEKLTQLDESLIENNNTSFKS